MTKTLIILTLLATILFIDIVLLIAIGCSAFGFGAGEQFYCGFFCKFSIALLSISTIAGLWFGINRNSKMVS